MLTELFTRSRVVWALGGIGLSVACALAMHSGGLKVQAAAAGPQAQAARPDAQPDDAAGSADASRGDAEPTDDDISPGNFLGSTFVPSIAATDGQPAMAVAVAPPPPPPKPADAAGDPVRQQINDETASLLAMAFALKSEVDKTNKDQLSISVVRKAGQIEQLAKKVRDDMRPALSKN